MSGRHAKRLRRERQRQVLRDGMGSRLFREVHTGIATNPSGQKAVVVSIGANMVLLSADEAKAFMLGIAERIERIEAPVLQ